MTASVQYTLSRATDNAAAFAAASCAGSAIAQDWRVSGILRAQSGAPLTINTGIDQAMNGLITNQRGNLIAGQNPYGDKTPNNWLNRAAFAQPDLGTFGNTTRGQFFGPSWWSVDMVLSRIFALGTGPNLEVRAEAFNVLNTVRWGDPSTALNDPNFGRILPRPVQNAAAPYNTTNPATLTGAGDPRILQFAVKYSF